ncbi:unnamed protein product, partial [Oikopleura dioica]
IVTVSLNLKTIKIRKFEKKTCRASANNPAALKIIGIWSRIIRRLNKSDRLSKP